MVDELLKYRIALTLVKGVGPVLARQLVAYMGGEEAIFREKADRLVKIPGIGRVTAADIVSANVLERAEAEIKFIESKKIVPLYFTEDNYPQRLLGCDDAPIMIYSRGNVDFNVSRVISVVGTRRVSDEGKLNCERLIEGIAEKLGGVLIVSGLAYGVDICAHRAALKCHLPTVGVLAHGLDRIYPPVHRQTAVEMVDNGALVSEFMSGTMPDKPNFVKRNRIIAGMADAVVVIESGEKGGALITARLASSYNRDVLAFPGRVSDPMSAGCHWLIKKNVAGLIENATDMGEALGWDMKVKGVDGVQKSLFVDLKTQEENTVYQLLLKEREIDINTLCLRTQLPVSKVSAVLLGFEFEGMVRCLPGNCYRLV